MNMISKVVVSVGIASLMAACTIQVAPAQVTESLNLETLAKPGKSEEHRAAEVAALRTLEIVDAERFAEVWDAGAPALKKTVARHYFVDSVGAFRKQLGKPLNRTLAFSGFVDGITEEFPERHAVIVYRTEFRARTYEEKVVMAIDANGTWIPAGYFYKGV